MATMPGLDSEVFFGDAEKPLPDWRKPSALRNENDDDKPLTAEERKAIVGVLGFDPDELDEETPASP